MTYNHRTWSRKWKQQDILIRNTTRFILACGDRIIDALGRGKLGKALRWIRIRDLAMARHARMLRRHAGVIGPLSGNFR